MQGLIKSQDIIVHIKEFIDCFCALLKHVDVNLFVTQSFLAIGLADELKRQVTSLKKTTFIGTKGAARSEYRQNKALDFQLIN